MVARLEHKREEECGDDMAGYRDALSLTCEQQQPQIFAADRQLADGLDQCRRSVLPVLPVELLIGRSSVTRQGRSVDRAVSGILPVIGHVAGIALFPDWDRDSIKYT